MSKLTTLGALALAFSIGGIAAAAEDTNTNTNTNEQSQPQQTQQAPATVEQRELEYIAAVNKCERDAEERDAKEEEKQKCFDAARDKHGQM